MSHHRPRLSRRDAERLLDDPSATSSVLGTALSAASVPARAGELSHEEAALAAFRTARMSPSPASSSRTASPSRLANRAAARAVIATGAIVALTSGGFALANSAHLPGLPGLPGQASDQATESVARTPKPTETSAGTQTTAPGETTGPSTASQSSQTSASEDGQGGTATTESADSESPSESTTPTPNFRGLCTAFQASDHSGHGKSLDSAAFTALATEAGGADRIATYCVALIGEPTTTAQPTPTTKPTPTNKPTDKPTPGKPTDKPTPGKPTSKPTPTNKPNDKPSPGKPTDKPAPAGQGGGKDSTTSGS